MAESGREKTVQTHEEQNACINVHTNKQIHTGILIIVVHLGFYLLIISFKL